MIQGLNHITIAVSDLELSLRFYVELLGFRLLAKWRFGAYLLAGDLWYCLNLEPAENIRLYSDSSHIAFTVLQVEFHLLRQRILDSGAKIWKANRSEGDSLYFLDPDQNKLEIHVGDVQSRIVQMESEDWEGMELYSEEETSSIRST